MKKFLSLYLIVSFIYNVSFSQVTLAWLKINQPSQSAGSVAVDQFNNSYAAAIAGNTTYLTKRDAAGNLLWSASGSSSYLEGIVKVCVDADNNPVVAGFQYTTSINGIVARGLIVRKFTASGDSVYRTIVGGLFTYLDGGDIEHPGNNQTKISAVMDSLSNVYFATAGEVNSGKGFQAVKIAPGGNLEWLRVQNFNQDTTGNPLFLAKNITVKNNRVGITGTTDKTFSNAATWVLSTAGNTIWNNITPKIAGADIVFDNALNAFVLATASNAVNNTYTGGDIAVVKFNTSGKKVGSRAYDFGSNEMPLRIMLTPDKNFVIMARADGTSSLGFMDWFTVKIKSNFDVLWTNRYNQSNYDEMPRAMIIDAAGNVYVTGSGGPDTGEFLYGLYGVTIKYSPSGVKRWQSVLHLQNFTPVDIALGKDTSVFVVSAPNAGVARFLQKGKTASCTTPSALKTISVTKNTATVTWKKVPDVFLYYVQYKTATATEWVQVTADSNRYTLQGLQQGTNYNFRVQAICATEPSDISAAANFKTTGAGYCASKGPDNNCQWIEGVQLGPINTYGSGPNNGYKDFTNLSADIKQGSTYTITTNKYNLCGSTEAWRIWIDYNHDGDFDDANELIIQYSNNYNFDYHDFTVPSTALTGTTRMRVSMKAGTQYSTPCEALPDGEVEDYTVNILPASFAIAANAMSDKSAITVSPNPAKDFLIVHSSMFKRKSFVQIFNANGKMVTNEQTENTNEIKIDVRLLNKGIYMLKVIDAAGNSETIKWMKE